MLNCQVWIEKLFYIKQGIYLLKRNWKIFDSICFRGKSHFEDDGTQNWLVFQPIQRYFNKVSANDSNILSRKSEALSGESIKPPTMSNKFINSLLDYVGSKTGLSMNILCVGDKSPAQRDFFKNSIGDLLPTLRFLGGLCNFCNYIFLNHYGM